MSAGLNADRLKHIDRFLEERYVGPGRLPGAITLVQRRGKLAHFGVIGQADVERSKALKDDTIFRIYSMSKPITSVAFMMLVEEGKVALDTPVHRVIPEWRDLGVYAGGFMETYRTTRTSRPMMMIDLLRHTSGLTYGFQQRTNVDAGYRKMKLGEIEKAGTLDSMIADLAKLPLEFSPGDQFNYSVSTDILGYLVGKLSGMPFETFLKERIFKPLGMVDTDFYVPPEKHARFAANYQPVKGGMKLFDDPETSSYLKPPSFISGGGGLVSTAKDYLAFASMMLSGGSANGTRFLSPKTVQLMTANHLPGGKTLAELSTSMFSEVSYAGVGFGLGFSVTTDFAATMLPGSNGDYSWGGAASTYFWIDPKEELICIFLTQLLPSSTYPVRQELRTLVYSAFEDMNA
jgi:CubicO group peptidase (beta-lactamase class C family)